MTGDFWPRLAVAALVIVGVWTLFGEGMLLGWLGDVWQRRLPMAINKPVWMCPPCMASVWGTAIWFYTGGDAETWPIFVLALCGVMKLCVSNFLKHG